jgi:hypothetical protein
MLSISASARSLIRSLLSTITPTFAKRILAISTYAIKYRNDILISPEFKDIFGSWRYLLDLIPYGELKSLKELKILYIEFGVFKGRSIKWFAENQQNPDSIFVGLDTFEGLPQAWVTANQPAGMYTANGIAPIVKDERILFIRGLFNQSHPEWSKILKEHSTSLICIAHMDSDIYGSALYTLSALSHKFDKFYVIFDEFLGDECRAFEDFKEAYFFESTLLCSGHRSFDKNKIAQQRNVIFLVQSIA